MDENTPRNFDPQLMERAAKLISQRPASPMIAPVGMPAAPGPGGYMRYREMTIDEMLLENRVVFMVGEINHVSASNCIMRLLYLQSVKRDQDINLYINSPGGVVDDTLAIYDVMKFLSCDVATYCIGRAESGGGGGFLGGEKGESLLPPPPQGGDPPPPRGGGGGG